MATPRAVLGGAHRWVRKREPVALIAFAVMAGGLWAFAELADGVSDGKGPGFDEAVFRAFRSPADPSDPIGPTWVEETARDVTALGGVALLNLLALVSVGFLLLDRKRREALFLTGAVAGGWALMFALKAAFERPRPDLGLHRTVVYTASFPSGHALMSAVTYLTLGALLARVTPRGRMKAYLMSWAAATTLLIGVSRVYLGVHWPTDVLAGWALGASWALCCWLAARGLQRARKLEGDGTDRGASDAPRLS